MSSLSSSIASRAASNLSTSKLTKSEKIKTGNKSYSTTSTNNNTRNSNINNNKTTYITTNQHWTHNINELLQVTLSLSFSKFLIFIIVSSLFILFVSHSYFIFILFLDSFSEKPRSYWTTKQGMNSRKFLEEFAKSKNFNPLVAENWYKVQKKDFTKHKVWEVRRGVMLGRRQRVDERLIY